MMSKAFKEGIERGAEQVTQAIKETLPKVQFNKNGYEIRTKYWTWQKHIQNFLIHLNGWVLKTLLNVIQRLVKL